MGSLYCLRQLLSPSSFVPPAKHCSSPAVQPPCSSHLEVSSKDLLRKLCGSVCAVSSSCTIVWLSVSPVCEVLRVCPRAVWKVFLLWKGTKNHWLHWAGRDGPHWRCKGSGGILTSPVLCHVFWEINCTNVGMRQVMQLTSHSWYMHESPWFALKSPIYLLGLGLIRRDCFRRRNVTHFHGVYMKLIKVRRGNRSAFLISDVIL